MYDVITKLPLSMSTYQAAVMTYGDDVSVYARLRQSSDVSDVRSLTGGSEAYRDGRTNTTAALETFRSERIWQGGDWWHHALHKKNVF